MKIRIYHMLLVTACTFLMFSCTEEQNFDQIDDLAITPNVAAPLFYVESDEQTINNSVTSTTFYTQTVDFQVFSEAYVAERLLEGTITYSIENTTSKDIFLSIEFLDASGNVLDTELFNVPSNLTEALVREVVYGPGGKSLEILTATTQLRITANNLGDTTSTSTNADPKVELGSAAEFLFRLK